MLKLQCFVGTVESQAAWPEVVPFTFGALMSELPEEREVSVVITQYM
jgi:hypothetical protein